MLFRQLSGKRSLRPALCGLLAVFSLLQWSVASAQQGQVVSGTVTGGDIPMAGVSVVIKGSATGVVTATDGKYSIRTNSDDDVLQFYFLGYQTVEETVGTRTVINVTLLEDAQSIEDVLVIGYGRQSRETVTASISRIGEEEFKYAQTANPLAALQGKVAGLSLQIGDGQPGSAPQVFIRGGASTSPENDEPLIIIDGVVGAMRNLNQLNPDDIESVQVLKDAASTAIYGARAAYGVIIVKTKSGKFDQKPTVTFKYVVGMEEMGNKYDFTSARDYVYISRLNTMKFNTSNPNQFLSNGTYGMSTGNPRNSRNTLAFLDTYISSYGEEYVQDLINNQGWETMIDPVTGKRLIFKETNYQDVTFQQALKHDMSVSVSGGTDKNAYYVGLGYVNQEGIVSGTWNNNFSFILNNTYKLHKKVSINTSVNYQFREYNNVGNYQNVLNRSVTMPFTYRLEYEDGLPAPGEGVTSFRNRNHEIYYRDKYNDNKQHRTTIQGGLTWDIMEGLSLTPSVSFFNTQARYNKFEAYNEVNKNRNASAQHDQWRDFQSDILLNYEKKFANKHNLNVVAGWSLMDTHSYVVKGSGYGAPTDNVTTLNATSEESQKIESTKSNNAMMSFFGRVMYDYEKRYMLSVSLRHDGSSRFPKNNRWGTFPGISAGWNVHNEEFWIPVKPYMSTMKIRSSWGQAGNNELSIYDTQGQYSSGYDYMGQVGIINTKFPNTTLRWETTTSFDVGVDMGFYNNRLLLLVDYYNKLTTDRLYDKAVDRTSGFASVKANEGSLRTAGIDIELNAKIIQRPSFDWNMSFTFSYSKSIVEKLPENGEHKNRIGGNTVYDPKTKQYVKVGGFAEGERYGGRWAYNMIGVYATDADAANAPYDVLANGRQKVGGDAIWEDRNGDGQIDHYDMVFMGYIRPDKMGGMVNSFRWKRLSARFVVDFAMGHVIDNAFRGRSLASARNNNMTLKEVMGNKIWNNQGDIATIPRYTVQSDADYGFRNHLRSADGLGGSSGYYTHNSLYYKKGDFIAFREVSLSYTIPEKFINKIGMQGCEVFAGVYNIGYITQYDGLMPEIYTGNDNGTYPRPRQYNFGVRLTF